MCKFVAVDNVACAKVFDDIVVVGGVIIHISGYLRIEEEVFRKLNNRFFKRFKRTTSNYITNDSFN